MKVAILGLGYWGPNLVRNFLAHKDVEEVIACDVNPKRLEAVENKFRQLSVDSDWRRVIERPDIEAVAIATPVHTHYALVKAALEAKKHVMVAKPFTSSVEQAEDLVALADKQNCRLMVDHTYLFTPAVRKIKELVDSGAIGELLYFDSVRINLGLFQPDVNVIWDLAPHDFSILRYLTDQRPLAVHATGMSHYGTHENIAYVTVTFERMIAHFHVNWVSPVKVRSVSIAGSKQLITFDELRADDKIRIYDSGVAIHSPEKEYEIKVQYRTGDMRAPRLDGYEALQASTRHFLDCAKSGQTPLSDGRFGRDVVQLLEAADRSLKSGGARVELEQTLPAVATAAAAE